MTYGRLFGGVIPGRVARSAESGFCGIDVLVSDGSWDRDTLKLSQVEQVFVTGDYDLGFRQRCGVMTSPGDRR